MRTNSIAKGLLAASLFTAALWTTNVIWLSRDTRPPVWDMALHQGYALNYLSGHASAATRALPPWSRSGNYPPFVHLVIALCFLVLHPGPHVAILANVPATFLLFWALYGLASDMGGAGAAWWTCALTALIPYLMWMSRTTILDYWLSAWVAVSLWLLLRSRGFENRAFSVLLGGAMALGMLTKWLFAAFLAPPIVYVCVKHKVLRQPGRCVNLADSLLLGSGVASFWYAPNIPRLLRYFVENAGIGAREGEPPVLTSQSFLYYLRLLEGYQLFAILFVLVCVSCLFVCRRRMLRDVSFLGVALAGGWLSMTLLRTKDPRFTMPLLGLLAVFPGAWIQSWQDRWGGRLAKTILLAVLCVQAYAVNFGISWLPQRIIIARGYQGSLRWDWNLYLQDYFRILGRPRKEDWRQAEILRTIARYAAGDRAPVSLAVVPDLPFFSAANFDLMARFEGMRIRVDHPQSAAGGIRAFDGYNYALMIEGEQGMPWTTSAARALNQIIVDEHEIFRIIELYRLPNGDYARLYFIRREGKTVG